MANIILNWVLASEGNLIGLFLMIDVLVSFLMTCAIMSTLNCVKIKIRKERRRQARIQKMRGNVVEFKKPYTGRRDTAA